MTEEELRKEIINEVLFAIDWDVEAIYDKDKMTTAIINAYREAGWKSPEEVQKVWWMGFGECKTQGEPK